MTLDILIPTIRPERVEKIVTNIRETTPEPHHIIIIAEFGDREVVSAVRKLLPLENESRLSVIYNAQPRGYPGAMNTAFHWGDGDVVFLGSDDVRHHPGWAEKGLAAFGPGIGVVGTNDLDDVNVVKGLHSTHSFVRRDYVNDPGAVAGDPGWLMFPGYRHYYTDVELVATARAREAFVSCKDSIVEHQRAAQEARGEIDERWLVQRQEFMANDTPIFRARCQLWGQKLKPFRLQIKV